jgi:vacuolar iron transporter family protein
MDIPTIKGFSFGVTSGIITTLGLMVGLNFSTHLKAVVIGGILTIAFADAFSDALGIHISSEAGNEYSQKQVWEATISTFITKLIIALTFVIPVLLFSLQTAILISVIWGLLLISVLSYFIAINEKIAPWKVVMEHLGITIVVIVVTYLIGTWINATFGLT